MSNITTEEKIEIEQLGDLLNIFNMLKSTNSKNEKASLIKRFESNKIFTASMKFLVNPFITTGISKKRVEKGVCHSTKSKIKTLTDALSYIQNHNTGRDEDISEIQGYLELLSEYNFSEDEISMIKELLTKELKLGVDSTWNKTVSEENKVPQFGCLLAKKYQDHESKIKGDFIITKKLDGTRCLIIKDKSSIKAFSRTGKEIEGLNEILDEMNQMLSPNSVVDGELLAVVDEGVSVQEQFSETLKRSRTKDKNKTGLRFHVFDWLTLEEFQNGKSKTLHSVRKGSLDMYMKSHGDRYSHIELVETLYQGSDLSKITEWTTRASEMGWEGIMISLDKPYVCKRTDSLLKVKKMHTMDLIITDIVEGDGKYVGMMGKCVVLYRGNGVGVGSGWSDDLRQLMFDNQEDYIGSVIEVQYFEISKDSKTGLESLRFPVFKRFRDDKTEESYD